MHRSGRSAPIWALSPCTPSVGMMDRMCWASMRALPGGAANARPGRGYQVLVHGHQPRALDTPVQAFWVTSIHTTIPRLAHYRGAPSACQIYIFTSRLMSSSACGCYTGPMCAYGAPEAGCKGVGCVYFNAQAHVYMDLLPQPCINRHAVR